MTSYIFQAGAMLFAVLCGIVSAAFFDYSTYCGNVGTAGNGQNACINQIKSILNQQINLRIGDPVVVYVTAQYFDENDQLQAITAQFFPGMDDFATLRMPNATFLQPFKPNLTVTVMAKDANNQLTLFKTPTALPWYNTTTMIPYRSIIVNVADGVIQSVDWEKQFCYTVCQCTSGVCAQCNDYNEQCQVFKIFLMWAGQDAFGQVLNSASRSIYRLQELP
ncbi:hypothetical protein MP228_012422 [Amoeboaphelidium protococcarum]|nr:hypothetical protein MP228_012422 [Amoeboaphelidium protococcarum]